MSIVDFFTARAAALSRNDIAALVRGFRLPIRILLGTASVYLANERIAHEVLTTYRSNIAVEGYARSEHDILHIAYTEDGKARVLSDWRDLNSRGAVINRFEASYFCEPTQEGGWQITVMEVLNVPPKRILTGIAVSQNTAIA